MDPSGTQHAAHYIIETLRRELFYLFLGSAFATVGLVSAAFAFLSRKFTPILFWFSLFSLLYGLRLWIGLEIVRMMLPASGLVDGLRHSSEYLLPIPAFFYFETAGLLSRYGKPIAYALTIVYLSLFVATLAFGTLPVLGLISNLVLIGSLTSLTVVSLIRKSRDPGVLVLRSGLVVFAASVLCGDISSLLGHYISVEPVGFAIFLVALGYVAARRSMQRDRQLNTIQEELEIAQRIQMANLPPPYRNSATFQVATRYVPMTAVAGDFYDFLIADDTQTGLFIADVSGHGVPAALIASMVNLSVSSQRANAADPAALLTGMNAALCGNTQDQFVTAAYVYLDAAAAVMRYSAAGHPPMLLLRDGAVNEIVENGLLLAAFSFATFTNAEYPLQPGDRIVLYTDGILEAANGTQEEFGQARLQALLRNGSYLSAQETADEIVQAVQNWSKTQEDDLTVLVCDYAAFA
jgi:sigma-B regulation protein RsbU (phosphoserine phosphatase)